MLALLTGAGTFLKSPLGRWLVAGLSCVALLGGAYGLGHHNGVGSEKAAEASRLAKATKQVAKREDTAKAISTDVAAKTEAARVEIQWRTKTLIEKVPTYVPLSADAECVIPVGFLRLHDAAAAGLPTPTGEPDNAPSGVSLSRVLATDVENLGVGYDYRAEVIAWRAWYAAQAKAWGKR